MKALSRQSSLVKILPRVSLKEKKIKNKETLENQDKEFKKSYSQVLESHLSRNSSQENNIIVNSKDVLQDRHWDFALDVLER